MDKEQMNALYKQIVDKIGLPTQSYTPRFNEEPNKRKQMTPIRKEVDIQAMHRDTSNPKKMAREFLKKLHSDDTDFPEDRKQAVIEASLEAYDEPFCVTDAVTPPEPGTTTETNVRSLPLASWLTPQSWQQQFQTDEKKGKEKAKKKRKETTSQGPVSPQQVGAALQSLWDLSVTRGSTGRFEVHDVPSPVDMKTIFFGRRTATCPTCNQSILDGVIEIVVDGETTLLVPIRRVHDLFVHGEPLLDTEADWPNVLGLEPNVDYTPTYSIEWGWRPTCGTNIPVTVPEDAVVLYTQESDHAYVTLYDVVREGTRNRYATVNLKRYSNRLMVLEGVWIQTPMDNRRMQMIRVRRPMSPEWVKE